MFPKILMLIFMVASEDLLQTIQRQMPHLIKSDLSCAHHNRIDDEFLGTENLAPLLRNSVSLTEVDLPIGQK